MSKKQRVATQSEGSGMGGAVNFGGGRFPAACAALALALAGACGGGSSGGIGMDGAGSGLGSAGDPGTGGTGAGGASGGGGASGAGSGGTGGASGAGGVSGAGSGGGAGSGTGGSSTGGAPGTGGIAMTAPHPPWTELGIKVVDVQGGTASSPGGVGQNGGLIHLVAAGDVSFDPSQPGVPAQSVPVAPADATTIASASLTADLTASGSATFAAGATTGGVDAVRKVVAGGDLFVTGTLRAADLGSARQGLTLQAGGTIYVSGAVDTSGVAGSGQAGGPIQLIAKQVVVTGQLTSAGGSGEAAGGPAGAITFQTSQGVFVTGTVDASGGNVIGAGSLAAGAAGTFKIQAGGDVGVAGVVLIRGGGASNSGAGATQGGAAASLVVDSNGAVTLGGVVDGRGGLASAATAGGTVVAGSAGSIHIGEYAPPQSIAILVPVVATGGDGAASAGMGGTLTPEPGTGSINVAGAHAIDLSGGSSMATPGAGGVMNGSPRTDPGSGGVHVTGDITLNGGSILAGGSGNGADGGSLKITVIPTDGPVLIDQSGNIVADGGSSGGTGTAGGGGHVWFWTQDGDITCAGHVTASGGDAPDPGGKGGLSGMIYFFSDDNHNAVEVPKGNLLITATGVLTSNGGDGTTGGDSRNYGMPGSVAPFGDGAAAMTQEEIAILLNCDGEHGNTNNWMENDGWLYANGGVHNGRGGDIVYHGIPMNARQDPNFDSYGDYPVPSGMIQNKGDGTGVSGTFDGE
ncbi:MAG TPA: hypothetical protein VMT03_11785 [Polyangia bacterium]|nr:hypothetical protein [Polyangia bacterium]